MTGQAAAFEEQCHAVSQNSGNLTAKEVQNVNAACDRLQSAVTPFRQKFNAMSAGLAHLEQVYQRDMASSNNFFRKRRDWSSHDLR